MTGLDYVKHRLLQDFGTNADSIIHYLTHIMTELTTPDDIEDELSSSDFHYLRDVRVLVANGSHYGITAYNPGLSGS